MSLMDVLLKEGTLFKNLPQNLNHKFILKSIAL